MATPVVMIHGMWATGADWARVRSLMEPRGYRCHAPTLPGHEPTADQPLRVGSLGLRDYVAALEADIAAQQFDQPPVLMGHSMGGLVAQQLATRLQPRALVLLAPAAPWGINGMSFANLRTFAPLLLRWGARHKPHKPSFETAQRAAFNGVAPERHRALYEGMVHESGRVAWEIGLWWADMARSSAVDPAAISCPVYVVSCGDDRLTPAASVRKVAARYRHSTHRHYPGRGHWVLDDADTEEMVHGICGWLRPLEQRAARAREPLLLKRA